MAEKSPLRWLRWVLILGIVGADIAYSQGTAAPVAPWSMGELIFGHNLADFIARMVAANLYLSSVISAGIHRAWPTPDPEKHRLVCLIGGMVDAMSVNGKGQRGLPPAEQQVSVPVRVS